jgi:MoaA/NifB/PqqE/SkfB family radical SAM enzyme
VVGAHGVDQFTSYWGHLHNYTDLTTSNYGVFTPKADRRLPQCTWPYFSMQIKYNGDVIPCCYHRHGEQYAGPGADSRVVGNVFESSVWDVWNSREYQALRRIVASPRRSLAEPELRTTFCDGCPTIFETDAKLRVRRGYEHDWDDLYTRDRRGRVWRREAKSGAPGRAG